MSDPLLHQEIDLSNIGKHDEKDDSNARDPIVTLGKNLLSYIVYMLPSKQGFLAVAGVSRRWRKDIRFKTIHSRWKPYPDSSCEDEIEAKMQEFANTPYLNRILHHLHRLSSLAANRVTKISLDLSLFLPEYEILLREWRDVGQSPRYFSRGRAFPFETSSNSAISRLLAALEGCEHSLKEICLQSETKRHYLRALSALLDKILCFRQLEKVRIVNTSMVSFTVGEDKPGSRYFSLTDKFAEKDRRSPSFRNYPLIDLMNQALKFIGPHSSSTISKFLFELDDWSDTLEDSDEQEMLNVLKDSANSLQSLGFYMTGRDTAQHSWYFIEECPNLTSFSFGLPRTDSILALAFYENVGDDGLVYIPFPFRPEGAPALKRLILIAEGFKTDLEIMSSWIGSELEHVRLESLQSDVSALLPGRSPTTFMSIIRNSSETLRSIVLKDLKVDEDYDETILSFPNLESLSLCYVEECFYQLFSETQTPQLKDLVLKVGESNATEWVVQCLWNLISQESSLQSISLEVSAESITFPIVLSDDVLPHLEVLIISMDSEEWFSWFSGFGLANLSHIGGTIEKKKNLSQALRIYDQFKENAPKLHFDHRQAMRAFNYAHATRIRY